MIWMTWRQHRAATVGALLFLAACAAVLIPDGLSMRADLDALGIGHCLGGSPTPGVDCVALFQRAPFGTTNVVTPWLNVVPVLLGVLLGAPVIAREIESGTYRLVWVQGITRTRWITVKLGGLALGVIMVSAAFAVMTTWWRQPVDSVDDSAGLNRFSSSTFGIEGSVVVGYAVFAFFLGVLAGTLFRRTLPAMVAACLAFVVVLFGVQSFARPHYLAPVSTLTAFPDRGDNAFTPDTTGTPGDWLMDWGYVDASGHRLTDTQIRDDMLTASHGNVPMGTWLNQHGIRHLLVYQPVTRFWTFQWIETGLFLALAAALAAAAIWHVQRRLP